MNQDAKKSALDDLNEFLASGDETEWQDVVNWLCKHKQTVLSALQPDGWQDIDKIGHITEPVLLYMPEENRADNMLEYTASNPDFAMENAKRMGYTMFCKIVPFPSPPDVQGDLG